MWRSYQCLYHDDGDDNNNNNLIENVEKSVPNKLHIFKLHRTGKVFQARKNFCVCIFSANSEKEFRSE